MTNYLIQHYVDQSSRQFPNRIAISCPDFKITYKECWVFSNQLANLLLAMNLHRQDRVAIFTKRSSKSILSMIGVLKADATYISIDRKTPLKRLLLVINDCQPRAIICDRTTFDQVQELLIQLPFDPAIVVFEHRHTRDTWDRDDCLFQDEIEEQPSQQPQYKNIDKDLAHIIYTSGSTGSPKGVMISHQNVLNYIEWAVDAFDISPEDVILSTAPFHFDMSTFDIFAPLKAGARLSIAPESALLFPKMLIDLMNEEKVTIWKGVSSLLMYLAKTRALEETNLSTLMKIIFAGEVFPTKYLIEWMQTFPDKEFYNGYGPSEATGVSVYYKVEEMPQDTHQIIPIGKACANSEAIVLNDDDTLSQVGEIGELCLRGSGVSPGYWNNPEKTNEVFVPHPLSSSSADRIYRTGDLVVMREDGNLEFVGRKDQQVKWMGYRIELGDIENTFLAIPEIKEAAVLLIDIDHSGSQKELVAFVELEKGKSTNEIQTELEHYLPHYMLPRRIIPIKGLPRTDRGKVNKHRLIEHYFESLTQSVP